MGRFSKHFDHDPNEVYPKSFKQEADMEKQRFRENVIAGMELAESALTDAGNALATYPGHGDEARWLHDEAARIGDMRVEIGGDYE